MNVCVYHTRVDAFHVRVDVCLFVCWLCLQDPMEGQMHIRQISASGKTPSVATHTNGCASPHDIERILGSMALEFPIRYDTTLFGRLMMRYDTNKQCPSAIRYDKRFYESQVERYDTI